MARRGYEIENQYPRRILSLLPDEKPGLRWSELWPRASRENISKPTLAKYLKALVIGRFALKEDIFYRANPTRNINSAEGMRGFATSHRDRLTALELWTDLPPPAFAKWSQENVIDPNRLRTWVDANMARISVQFIIALNEIVKIPKKAAAREYVDLFFKVDVVPMLHSVASEVWMHRNRAPVRELDGYVAHLQAATKYLD